MILLAICDNCTFLIYKLSTFFTNLITNLLAHQELLNLHFSFDVVSCVTVLCVLSNPKGLHLVLEATVSSLPVALR